MTRWIKKLKTKKVTKIHETFFLFLRFSGRDFWNENKSFVGSLNVFSTSLWRWMLATVSARLCLWLEVANSLGKQRKRAETSSPFTLQHKTAWAKGSGVFGCSWNFINMRPHQIDFGAVGRDRAMNKRHLFGLGNGNFTIFIASSLALTMFSACALTGARAHKHAVSFYWATRE